MNEPATHFTDLKPLALISADLAVSRTTVWRWKQRGWLSTITIAGKHYVAADEYQRFLSRASAGEFTTGKKAAKQI